MQSISKSRQSQILWLCAGLLTWLAGCTAPLTLISNHPSAQITIVSPVPLAEDSVRTLREFIDRAFGQSTDSTLLRSDWQTLRRQAAPKPDSAGLPAASSISILLHMLAIHNYTSFSLAPPTFESLRCMANLPIIACSIIRDFSPKKEKPLDRSELLSSGPALLNGLEQELSIRVIRGVRTAKGKCTFLTVDSLSCTGLSQDTVVGQLFSTIGSDSTAHYHQVAGLFFVTQLPAADIGGEIAEWYSLMPQSVTRPGIIILR
jgi:hypothetical protein